MSEFLSKLFGLDGRTAVVIGGTGVLGGSICEGLAAAGALVVVAGRSQERGEERVAAIEQAGGKAAFHAVDALSRDSLTALLKAAGAHNGGVDVLVNAAGVNQGSDYESIQDEDWKRVVDGNLTATHYACQTFAPQMAKQADGGSIINIGSVTSHLPLSRVFAYAAAKAAVVNLSKNVAREYAEQGVRVNSLCPGFFPAEQNRKILTPERIQNILGQTPMNRFGEPHELTGAILLMASPNAGSFLTGAELYVDGGFTGNRF